MTDFDRKADTNVTFRGECRCAEGFLYEKDPYSKFGRCTDECMFGTFTPKDAKAKTC